MTVCIAAHCAVNKCIVLASDMMVSTIDMSADLAAMKMYPVGCHWIAQFAGNDPSSVIPMLQLVEQDVGAFESLARVSQTFAEAYRYRLKQKVETEILLPMGFTLERFMENGLRQLGPTAFSRTLFEVQGADLGLEVLVSGFDGEHPHVFTVRSPGKFTYYSHIGFWAIGSGQTNALGSFFNSKSPVRTLDQAGILYRVCEAKFNAENAVGVGHTTTVAILYEDGSRSFPTHDDIEDLRSEWDATRVLSVPDSAKAAAIKILDKAKRSKSVTAKMSALDLAVRKRKLKSVLTRKKVRRPASRTSKRKK